MIRRFSSFAAPPAPPRLLALILPLVISTAANAAVKHVGTWPETPEKPVTLDMHAAGRTAALNELADAAGWSLVTHDLPETKATVNLHVKGQAPSELLDLLLSDGDYVATRSGNLVSLSLAPATASSPSDAAVYIPVAAAVPPAPPAGSGLGRTARAAGPAGSRGIVRSAGGQARGAR